MNDDLADFSDWKKFQEVARSLNFEEIQQRYSFVKIIKQLRNTIIRLCIHIQTGQQVVMKILNKSAFKTASLRLALYREIETMKLLGNHRHVVELYDVIDSGDRIWIVMEYGNGGDLYDFVKKNSPLPESLVQKMFTSILKIVAYMHQRNRVHRDLKLENILLDENGRIMLADFGLSRHFDESEHLCTSVCGTPQYTAPEIARGDDYNPIKTDAWCLGVILYLLIFAVFPFNGPSISEMFQAVLKGNLQIPPTSFSKNAIDLVQKLLTYDSNERISVVEALSHPYIHTQLKNNIIKTNNNESHFRLSPDDIVSYKINARKQQITAKANSLIEVARNKKNMPQLGARKRKPAILQARPQTANPATRFPSMSMKLVPVMDCECVFPADVSTVLCKLKYFIEAHPEITVLCAQDFGLYIKNSSKELYVSINVGQSKANLKQCGYSAFIVRGTPEDFAEFQQQLREFMQSQ